MVIRVYGIFTTLVAIVDLIVAYKSASHKNYGGMFLCFTSIASAAVAISYLVSITVKNYFVMSMANSIYFICIDVMLLFLLSFIIRFTGVTLKEWHIRAFKFYSFYFLFEVVVFLLNPFIEFVISYVPTNNPFVYYSYKPYFLYDCHLIYTYSIVAIAAVLLITKIISVPREYRITFTSVLLIMTAVVGVNAIFLFLPDVGPVSLIDFSICGYSFGILSMYWSNFYYRSHGLLNRLKNEMFDNIAQGLVLFDNSDHLVINNKNAELLVPKIKFNDDLKLDDFVKQLGYEMDERIKYEEYSVQCYGDTENLKPVRCDYRLVRNKRNRIIGRMFVFTDAAQEVDLITGFTNWESFKRLVVNNIDAHPMDMTMIVLDPNRLALINSLYGYSFGNNVIRELADLMRRHFPANTYYVRGLDAHLIASVYYLSNEQIEDRIKMIQQDFSGSFQYAINPVSNDVENILQTIEEAEEAMSTKKLLDSESKHSETLNSLIRALEQTDPDTKDHVKRTQDLGKLLGKRIGLSDIDQSKLDLLCILHDIGKIGVPLEILNKPGKLSMDERLTLQSHTEKGYQIAMSNKGLSGIAEMIKYHHERWDGKGYPDGLSRESIPLLSRVISVIDAYDAMVNDRSYRKALDINSAKEELRKNAGTQFDPHLVSEFLTMIDEDVVSVNEVAEREETVASSTSEMVNEIRVHAVIHSHYYLNKDNMILSIDDEFTKITGYSAKDVKELKLNQLDLLPEEDRVEYLIAINEQLANAQFAYFEHRLQRKDGSWINVLCFGRLYYDPAIREERSEIVITDVSNTNAVSSLMEMEQEKAQVRLSQWESKYRRDDLTGLLTHTAFINDVDLRLLMGNERVLFIMMDVDNFKQYNDTFGHVKGDEFLLMISKSIMNSLRKDDLACRMGGDEFAVALFFDSKISEETIKERALQLFDKVNFAVKSYGSGQAMSMGAALSNLDGDTTVHLYAKADEALYVSKNQGKAKLTFE